MNKEVKRWSVEYSHDDGREGTVEIITEVGKADGFQYGNGKYGMLKEGNYERVYDLRYCKEKDLHAAMLKDYFGDGLDKATEI